MIIKFQMVKAFWNKDSGDPEDLAEMIDDYISESIESGESVEVNHIQYVIDRNGIPSCMCVFTIGRVVES